MRGARLPRARKQSGYADGGSTGREWNDLIVGAELLHGAVAPAGRRLSVDPRIAPNFHSPAVDVEDPVVGHPAMGVEAGLLFTIESETRDGDLDDQGGARRMRVEEVPRRSEEHTSELQSQSNLVCRLLLEKKKKTQKDHQTDERRQVRRPRRRF